MTLPTTVNTTDPLAQGLDVQIGTTYFRLVEGTEGGLQVRTAPKQPVEQVPSTSLNPEDFDRDEGERVFSQVDFSGGEGLEYFHRREQVDADVRFWDSKGMELFDRRGEPAVLRATWQPQLVTSQAGLSSNGSAYGDTIAYAYDRLWFPKDDVVVRVSDPTGATPVIATEKPNAGGTANVTDVVALNGTLYAALGAEGIWTRTSGGTWSQFNTIAATRIWAVKGRIVAADDAGNLYEVPNATVPTATISLGANERFVSACDAGLAVLAATTNGIVYALADNSGTLINRGQTPFIGERIVSIDASQGRMIGILTVDTGPLPDVGRFYTAQLKGDYTLGGMQLIREFDPDAASGNGMRVLMSRDRAWVAIEDDPTNNLDIYEFRFSTSGLFRLYAHNPGTGLVQGMTTINGRLYWVTATGDLHRQHATNRQTTAYLVTALADHFDAKEKQVVGARLYLHQVPTGTTAKLYLSTDPDAMTDPAHLSWTEVVSRTSVDDSEVNLSGHVGRWLVAKVEVTTTDPTVTAEVRGFAIRSYQTERDVELLLPIECSDTLYKPGRAPFHSRRRGQEIYTHLQTLEGGSVDITLLKTSEQWRGNILEVSTRRPVINARGVEQLASVVRFRGRRL